MHEYAQKYVQNMHNMHRSESMQWHILRIYALPNLLKLGLAVPSTTVVLPLRLEPRAAATERPGSALRVRETRKAQP